MKIPKQEIKKARIEIIPMIDTIFFLLVFFMFTSLSMVQMKGMGVSLPKDSTADSKPPPKAIVAVDKTGNWSLSGAKIDPNALQADLQSLINANTQTVIIVSVDKSQNVQTLISVMDAVNGVTTPDNSPVAVMIATQPVNAAGQATGTTSVPGTP